MKSKKETALLSPPQLEESTVDMVVEELAPDLSEPLTIEEHAIAEGHVNVPSQKGAQLDVYKQKRYIYDMVKAHQGWGIGRKVSREEYLKAVESALKVGVG